MKETLIAGVDVSKSTLDIFFKPAGLAICITNDKAGFKTMFRELKTFFKEGSRVLIVMEHTGKYSMLLESFLRSKAVDYCRIPALEIQRPTGLTRGKKDRVDAQRIAEYAWLRRDILQADAPVSKQIIYLKELLSLRSKLVSDRAGYINRVKELKSCGDAPHRII